MNDSEVMKQIREELKKAYVRVPNHIYKKEGLLKYLCYQKLMKEIALDAGKKNPDLLKMQINALERAIKKLERESGKK